MKFRSLYKPRITNLAVDIKPEELKNIIHKKPKSFYFIWLSDSSFVISSNFSFGSNFIFDVNRPNTKSEIIFYGQLAALENSGTHMELRTTSKYFLASLLLIMPSLVIVLQIFVKFELPVFLILLLFFPLAIIGLMNFISSEEKTLLRKFQEHLNDEILKFEKQQPPK